MRVTCYVKDLKHEIVNQDLEKYFIDGIDEATTPKKVINKATKLLNKMLKKDSDELNIKQLPFYLTHLMDEDYLESKLEELINEISFNEIGRGSLFKHFYRNVVFNFVDKITLDFYKHIQGLSRANFINELSNHSDKIPINQLEEITSFYLTQDLSEHEKIEIIRLVLKLGLNLNLNELNEEDMQVIIHLAEYTTDVVWNEELLARTLIHLQQIDNKEKVLNYMECILSNSREISEYRYLIESIYTTISENEASLFKKGNKQVIYNLISFISMFLDEAKIKDVWSKFRSQYSNEIDGATESIIYHDWYKYKKIINRKKLNGSTIILILTRIFKKEGIIPEVGVSVEEENFSMFLFLYLFDSDEFEEKDEMRGKIKEVIKNKNIRFLEWCLDGEVSYYPNDDVAIKNIHLNNRVIMLNGEHLLIRGLPRIFEDYDTELSEIEEWYDDQEYKFIPYKLSNKLMNLEDKLEGMDYFSALEFLLQVESKSATEAGYINVFERGTFKESNDDIFHSYSKYDTSIVINEKKVIKNERNNLLSALIESFIGAKIKEKKYPLNYVYKHQNFINDFIPKLIETAEKRHEYIQLLVNNLNFCKDNDNLYTVEMVKVKTIHDYIKKIEIQSKNTTMRREIQTSKFNNKLKVLHYYNSLYHHEKNFEKHLLYGVQKIDDSNLYNVIQGIMKSVKTNIELDDISFIIEFFEREQKTVQTMSSESDLSLFKLVTVEQHIMNKSKVKVDRKEFDLTDISFYEFGTTELGKPLTSKDMFRLDGQDYVYFNGNYLIMLPDSIVKILEIVSNKEGLYDKTRFLSEITIVNKPFYKEAKEVIELQSQISSDEAEVRLHSFLYDIDSKYHNAILKVISSYRNFKEEEMELFKNTIVKLINEKKDNFFIPLKGRKDDNGLHQILYGKYKDVFERNTENEKRTSEDYKKLTKIVNIDNLIIFSDLGLSGGQIKKTLKSYLGLSNKKVPNGINIQNKINFKTNFLQSKKITLLNCIFTNKYKNEVTSLLKEDIGYQGEIEFLGKEIEYENYVFANRVDKKNDRDLFVEFVRTYYKNEDFDFIDDRGYFGYLEGLEESHTRNMLIARYKSMPKYHHKVFTNNTALLKYRED